MLEQNRRELMSQPGVLGVGIGASDINNQGAAIIVYVDQTSSRRPQLPDQIDGVRVRVVFTDPIIAFKLYWLPTTLCFFGQALDERLRTAQGATKLQPA